MPGTGSDPRGALVRRVLGVAAAAVVLAACGASTVLDVGDLAGDVDAPPRDAELVEGGDRAAAAWIRREVQRTDRPVVVKFFASWCGPCEEEMPVLQRARAAHPEVAFLGVAHQDPREQAATWLADLGVEDLPTLLDLEGATARTFGARGMPAVSFVDREGRLLHTHTGPIDAGLLEDWIAHLAGEGPRPDVRPDTPATGEP